MATQTSLLTFTGRPGNIIGYCRNGRYFLRSMPQTVRQTTATRHQGIAGFRFNQRAATGIRFSTAMRDGDFDLPGNDLKKSSKIV